jgi:hypothetical protein
MFSSSTRRFAVAVTTLASLASVACSPESQQSVSASPSNPVDIGAPPPNPGGGTDKDAGPCTLAYPYTSSNPLTSLAFNESEVLRSMSPAIAKAGETIKVWYNDEHALTLGVRQVIDKSAKPKTTTTNYALATLVGNPGHVTGPSIGAMELTGKQAGVDAAGRPLYPALFITDITTDSTSKAGDWQYGGLAYAPDDIFGTWKGALRTVATNGTATMTPDNDPSKNSGWKLGLGSDSPEDGFASLKDEGYGAEIRWNVDNLPLVKHHIYRIQVMVHDGDQNKTGGDVGQACMTVQVK